MDKQPWAEPVWFPIACKKCKRSMGSVNVAGRLKVGVFAPLLMWAHGIRARAQARGKFVCGYCRQAKPRRPKLSD